MATVVWTIFAAWLDGGSLRRACVVVVVGVRALEHIVCEAPAEASGMTTPRGTAPEPAAREPICQ